MPKDSVTTGIQFHMVYGPSQYTDKFYIGFHAGEGLGNNYNIDNLECKRATVRGFNLSNLCYEKGNKIILFVFYRKQQPSWMKKLVRTLQL